MGLLIILTVCSLVMWGLYIVDTKKRKGKGKRKGK
jgi:hypothetical protein